MATGIPSSRQLVRDSLRISMATAANKLSTPPYAVKVGEAIPAPGGALTMLVPGGVIDLHKAGFPNAPYRLCMPCSSDHDNTTSGPRFYYAHEHGTTWYSRSEVAAEFASAGMTFTDTSNPVAIASWPGGTDLGEYFWLRDRGDGTLVLYGHSNNITGGTGHTGFYATSTDGVNFTYAGMIDAPMGADANLVGGYSNISEDGGIQMMHATATDIRPITFQHLYCREDFNWRPDYRLLQNRDCTLWGYHTREINKNWIVMRWRGAWWALATFRDIPSTGPGSSLNGDLVSVRISDDFRRVVGPAYICVARGTGGSFDDADIAVGLPVAYCDERQPNRIHLYYGAKSDVENGSVGYAYIDADDYTMPEQAWAAQSGFAEACNIDMQGNPLPCGRYAPSTLIDLRAGIYTTKPSELTQLTGSGSPTYNYKAANNADGACFEVITGSTTDHNGGWYLTQGVDPRRFSEIWVDIEGLTGSVDVGSYQIGFMNWPTGNRGFLLQCLMASGAGNDVSRIRTYNSSGTISGTSENVITQWNLIGDQRNAIRQQVSVGLTYRKSTDNDSTKKYVEVWCGDQVVRVVDVTSHLDDAQTLMPFFRVLAQNSTAITARISRFRVRLGDPL